MRKIAILVTAAMLTMMVLASAALAQQTNGQTPGPGTGITGQVPESGGPAILLPVAALLLGSGILTFAIVRRR